MPRLVLIVALRLLACGAATYAVWRLMGPIAFAVCAPLFGIALARPIIDGLSAYRAGLRRLAYASVEGHHYTHRGVPIDVVEDERRYRWVSTGDVRKVISTFSRDATLRHRYPLEVRDGLALGGLYIRADTLLHHLEDATEPDAVKFKLWLRKDVVLPASNLRRRLGIREEASGPGEGQRST